MTDRVLLSASDDNLRDCIDLAVRDGLGIEIMHFAYPDVLDTHWREDIARYRRALAPVPGKITMHGPFMDMAPGSPDRRVNAVCRERYEQAIRIGHELGVELIVFHANFIASIQSDSYRHGWQQRNIDFWGEVAEFARSFDIPIAVENMWEFDPDIIGDVLKVVNHTHLGACLDVGHARLFSHVAFEGWLDSLGGLIIHTHLNNNNGVVDVHRALNYEHGPIHYDDVITHLRALPRAPGMTLEMDHVEDMRASLPFFNLPKPTTIWRNHVKSS